jgi:hypothetical protein
VVRSLGTAAMRACNAEKPVALAELGQQVEAGVLGHANPGLVAMAKLIVSISPCSVSNIGAVKAWHQRLGMAAPADGPGDYRRLKTSLARFQPCPRLLKFPIHAAAVRRLLLLPFPAHPACCGVIPPATRGKWVLCPICWAFLLRWFDCLASATATLICSRCKELRLLQVCDIGWRYDEPAG